MLYCWVYLSNLQSLKKAFWQNKLILHYFTENKFYDWRESSLTKYKLTIFEKLLMSPFELGFSIHPEKNISYQYKKLNTLGFLMILLNWKYCWQKQNKMDLKLLFQTVVS